jgi:hypothetical protein
MRKTNEFAEQIDPFDVDLFIEADASEQISQFSVFLPSLPFWLPFPSCVILQIYSTRADKTDHEQLLAHSFRHQGMPIQFTRTCRGCGFISGPVLATFGSPAPERSLPPSHRVEMTPFPTRVTAVVNANKDGTRQQFLILSQKSFSHCRF